MLKVTKCYCEESGLSVPHYTDDHKKLKLIHYGDFESKNDDWLITKREKLMDYLEKDKTMAFINRLHELQEVERELTLRENQ